MYHPLWLHSELQNVTCSLAIWSLYCLIVCERSMPRVGTWRFIIAWSWSADHTSCPDGLPSFLHKATSHYVGTSQWHVQCPLADLCITGAAREACAVTELAASCKRQKYWCPVSLRAHCSWEFGRHQHYSSWTTMVGVWLLTLARLERLASCISASRS